MYNLAQMPLFKELPFWTLAVSRTHGQGQQLLDAVQSAKILHSAGTAITLYLIFISVSIQNSGLVETFSLKKKNFFFFRLSSNKR